MNSRVTGLRVAGALFALFAFAHVWRLLAGMEMMMGPHRMPAVVSIVAALVAGALAFWMWMLASQGR